MVLYSDSSCLQCQLHRGDQETPLEDPGGLRTQTEVGTGTVQQNLLTDFLVLTGSDVTGKVLLSTQNH